MSEPAPGTRLFLPGPTEVDPQILAAMAHPAIGHRGPEIRELIEEVELGLQWLLGTRQPVLLFTSAATTVMEAAVLNTVGEHGILHLVCGAFSERWFEISRSHGRPAERLEVDWGRGFTPEQVREALGRKRFDAVAVTHNETSTGVMNPLREIAAVVHEFPDTLLLVDAVSSMAAVRIPFEEWGLDVLLAGVQKAFALPAGLTVAAVSQRTLERAARLPHRGWSLDFLRAASNLEKHQTPVTPSTAHLHALRCQLLRFEDEGLEAREERHRAMANRCQQWARRHLSLFADESFLSPTVTCVRTPPERAPAELLAALRTQGIVLGGGYGPLKNSTFRIGHMGEHTLEDVDDLLRRIEVWLGET